MNRLFEASKSANPTGLHRSTIATVLMTLCLMVALWYASGMGKNTLDNLDVHSMSFDELVMIAKDILDLKKKQDDLVMRLSGVRLGEPLSETTSMASMEQPSESTASSKRLNTGAHISRAAGAVFNSLQKQVKAEVIDLGQHKTVERYAGKVIEIWDKVIASSESQKAIKALGSLDKSQVYAKIDKVKGKFKGKSA